MCLAVLLMMLVNSSPCLATTIQSPETEGTMLVIYHVDCAYLLTIPDKVAFRQTSKGTVAYLPVVARNVYLWPGTRLTVRVESANSWDLRFGADHYAYSASSHETHDSLKNGSVVMEIDPETMEQREVLDVTLEETVTTAGNFTDTLTFILTIDEV